MSNIIRVCRVGVLLHLAPSFLPPSFPPVPSRTRIAYHAALLWWRANCGNFANSLFIIILPAHALEVYEFEFVIAVSLAQRCRMDSHEEGEGEVEAEAEESDDKDWSPGLVGWLVDRLY